MDEGNTYRYVHEGFYSASLYSGHETYWINDSHKLDDSFFNDSFILTEGWANYRLPVAKNSTYVIHHFGNRMDMGRYLDNRRYIANGNRVFDMRFLCPRMEDHNYEWKTDFKKLQKVTCCTFLEPSQGYTIVYQPWATNLFPEEIVYREIPKEKVIYYIGTVGIGGHHIIPDWKLNNRVRIDAFIRACTENGIPFKLINGIPTSKCRAIIEKSYIAPDIRDIHKKESGYISCRVFKNISYGQLGITDVKEAYDLFEHSVAYHDEPYDLFYEAIKHKDNVEMIKHAMDLVRNNHTYVHRLKTLTGLSS